MEATVPSKPVVGLVAVILVLLAGFGAYQGIRRSSTGEQDTGEAASSLTAPIAGAKTASALAEPTAPALTEAQVREIARQEARAALGKPDGAAAPTNAEGTVAATSADGSTAAKPAAATTAAVAPRLAPAQPALQTPAAPTPTPETNPPPLF